MPDVDPQQLALGPATRLLWRAPDSVHLEMGSHALVVDGLPAQVVSRVASPSPPTGATELDEAAGDALTALARAGYLWPRPTATDTSDPAVAARLPPTPRLAAELTALAARHGDRAAELLAARRSSTVVVHGSGRVAAHLAALLAAAGVGRVHCAGAGAVRLVHAVPGGVLPADEGVLVATAADAAVLRAAPDADTTPLPVGVVPDLTVLAVDTGIDEDRRAALHADGAAHLSVALGVDHGVIGPLVIPGLTSCLRCADLHRRDRDPAWPALALQLSVPHRHGAASDVAVATVVVGAAALQVLAFLDGEDPACVEGTLELRLPDWRLRRRSRAVHPDCGCTPLAARAPVPDPPTCE